MKSRVGYGIPILLLVLLSVTSGVFAQEATRIIFLHHSCGHNLIEEGGVRQGLSDLGYEFYDHGYNGDGLRLADGSYTGTNFDVPGDNTDPDGLAGIFRQSLHDPPDNTFSHLMEYDVIAFKSCFPVSNIGSDSQLSEYQSYYLTMRDRMDQYPDKIFIVVTQPPQVPGNTDRSEATRARALADWLSSDEFLAGHPNVFAFDFFDLLADDDNLLRSEYRYSRHDGHPNERANQVIGPLFVDFIDQAIRSYEGAGTRPTPQPGEPEPPADEPPSVPVAAGMIDDFEGESAWWGDAGEGSTVACQIDAGVAYSGAASLRIDYDVAAQSWVDCGRSYDEIQNWGAGEGLSVWLRAEQAGLGGNLMVFSGVPENSTPFEMDFETVADGWVQLLFPWDDLYRAEWADESGLSEIDPTRITGYGFTLWTNDVSAEGVLWIDDVELSTGEGSVQPPAPGEDEPVPELPVDEEPGGGLCPLSAVALPLVAVALFLLRRRL
jgi:hypothetical protein